MKKLITMQELCNLISVSRSWIYLALKDPNSDFPQPLRLGSGRAVRWDISEVRRWMKTRERGIDEI